MEVARKEALPLHPSLNDGTRVLWLILEGSLIDITYTRMPKSFVTEVVMGIVLLLFGW